MTENNQPLTYCFLAAAFGVIADRCLDATPFFWLFLMFAALGLWLFFRNSSFFCSTLILLGVFAFFAFWHQIYSNRYETDNIGLYVREAPIPVCLQGVVIEMPRHIPAPKEKDPMRTLPQKGKTYLTLKATSIRNGRNWQPVCGKIAVFLDGTHPTLEYGDAIQILGDISCPIGKKNPDDADYRNKLRDKRILCQLRSDMPEKITLLKKSSVSFFSGLTAIRKRGQEHIRHYFSAQNAAIVQAMLLGIRDDVDNETNYVLLETGTMHILSISGLHVGLIGGTIYWMLRFMKVSRRKTAVLLAVFVLFYLFLTDVRAPAIRATVLFIFMSFALYYGRELFALNTLSATALVVLFINPTDLFTFGPQLSFLATAAFLWMPRTEKKILDVNETIEALAERQARWEKDGMPTRMNMIFSVRSAFRMIGQKSILSEALSVPFFGTFARLFVVSIVITAITTPLIISQIHIFAPIAILVNPLLWIPLTGILLSGLGVIFTGFFSATAAGLIGYIGDFFCDVLLWILNFFNSIPYGYFWVQGPPSFMLAVFYFGIVFFTLFPKKRPKLKNMLFLLASWIIVCYGIDFAQNAYERYSNRLQIIVCSVGHGNAVVIRSPEGKIALCDAGCFSNPRMGADVLSRAIWRLRKTKIDALFISHPDVDHFNAVPFLLERFSIKNIYVTPQFAQSDKESVTLLKKLIKERKVPIEIIHIGKYIPNLGKTTKISVLHPLENVNAASILAVDSDNSNAMSLVLKIEHCGKSILLPGDLDSLGMPTFMKQLAEPFDILMIPHHGGNSKSLEPLLSWAKPKTLLVSAGSFTYNAEKMQSLRKRGFSVLNTHEGGAINATFAPEKDNAAYFREIP